MRRQVEMLIDTSGPCYTCIQRGNLSYYANETAAAGINRNHNENVYKLIKDLFPSSCILYWPLVWICRLITQLFDVCDSAVFNWKFIKADDI